MARWVTDERARWFPQKEKVALRNNTSEPIVNPSATWSNFFGQTVEAGEPYIYEGPDRAAMQQLYEEGVDHLGGDFHNDPELITRVRQLGWKDVDEYAKVMGFDVKKAKERFEKESAVIQGHKNPTKKKKDPIAGGGIDTTGQGESRLGGFGDPPKE